MRALILIASPVALLQAQAAERIVSARHIVVQTDDVTRFFKVLDANQGRPSADDLQHGYLDAGTDALRSFTDRRIGSMERLARAIQDKPALLRSENLRDRIAIDPHARRRCRRSTWRPVAVCALPPVTVLVGRGNSGGVTTEAGVVIGLEALCNADWMQTDVGDRFVHLIAHEYVHVQQPGARVDIEQPTLLYQTLLEGGAEYVAERSSGQPANAHLQRWTQGRECALERAFLQDSMGTDLQGGCTTVPATMRAAEISATGSATASPMPMLRARPTRAAASPNCWMSSLGTLQRCSKQVDGNLRAEQAEARRRACRDAGFMQVNG